MPLGLVFCLVLILVNREGATDSQPVHEVSPRTTPAPTTSSHQSRPPNETRITALGVSAGGPDATASFERWLGRPVDLSHAFLPERTWGEIEVGAGWARWWGGSAYADRMLISVPMLPEDDPSATLALGATGAYDAHFRAAAQQLVRHGMGNALLRIGWEFNRPSVRWAARGAPSAYAAYFRHIVTAFRDVSPGFRFTWCPAAGYYGWDARAAYPGDSYVDVISTDSYDAWFGRRSVTSDQRWHFLVDGAGRPGGLQFWDRFATAHGKPTGFAEWGLQAVDLPGDPGPRGGGGDDPDYIGRMHEWAASHDVAFLCYFDRDGADGAHRLSAGRFPRAAAQFLTLW